MLLSCLAAGAKPIGALCFASFDETPMKLRLNSAETTRQVFRMLNPSAPVPEVAPPPSGEEVIKVFQTIAKVEFLFEENGQDTLVSAMFQVPLAAADHSTAEVTKAIVTSAFDVPSLQRLLERFPRVLHAHCSDSASSNQKAERLFVEGRSEKESHLWVGCDVHRCHTSLTNQMSLVDRMVSGLVNCSLSMRGGGALRSLRRALACYFQSHLRVFRSARPVDPQSAAGIFRESVIACRMQHAPLPRVMVIRQMLNGNWQETGTVEHICTPGCCESGPEQRSTIDIFVSDVCMALIPCALPLFPRSRWTKADHAVEWAGVLQQCHGLLQAILPVWLREQSDSSQPVCVEDFAHPVAGLAVGDLAEDIGPRGLQIVGAPLVGDCPVDNANPQLEEGLDHKAFNERARVGAKEFASLPRLACSLTLARVAMKPHLGLTAHLLKAGSEETSTRLSAESLSGMGRGPLRFVDCAEGQITRGFSSDVRKLLFAEPWIAVPSKARDTESNCLAFRLVSKGAGAITALVTHTITSATRFACSVPSRMMSSCFSRSQPIRHACGTSSQVTAGVASAPSSCYNRQNLERFSRRSPCQGGMTSLFWRRGTLRCEGRSCAGVRLGGRRLSNAVQTST